MKSSTKAFVSFGILILLLVGLFFFTQWFSLITGYVLGEDEKVKLAQCLDGKNSILYVSETCPDCLKQIDQFGEATSEFLNVITCHDLSQKGCEDISGFPAWKIKGEYYYGVQNLEYLQEISGCSS